MNEMSWAVNGGRGTFEEFGFADGGLGENRRGFCGWELGNNALLWANRYDLRRIWVFLSMRAAGTSDLRQRAGSFQSWHLLREVEDCDSGFVALYAVYSCTCAVASFYVVFPSERWSK